MVTVKLFVEGGASQAADLDVECRKAFRQLLVRAGLKGRMPRIVASGSRTEAFGDFTSALADASTCAVLLVDSEGPIADGATCDGSAAWAHVAAREGDHWQRPTQADPESLHLMVQCMESWLVADRRALTTFYGQGFREGALPDRTDVERIGKDDLYRALESATRNAKTKGAYRKGRHSFLVLATIDPAKVRLASPWADRFFAAMAQLAR